jgi:hypothetical protein
MSAAKNPRQLKMASSRDAALETLPPPLPASREWWGKSHKFASHAARSRKFAHVPTHVVSVAEDHRGYPRAALSLPLKLTRVAGQRELGHAALATVNISSSGIYFRAPEPIELGTPVELEVHLVKTRNGRGSVRMTTLAHIVRLDLADERGLYGMAVAFDDITFQRDEPVPLRYQKP